MKRDVWFLVKLDRLSNQTGNLGGFTLLLSLPCLCRPGPMMLWKAFSPKYFIWNKRLRQLLKNWKHSKFSSFPFPQSGTSPPAPIIFTLGYHDRLFRWSTRHFNLSTWTMGRGLQWHWPVLHFPGRNQERGRPSLHLLFSHCHRFSAYAHLCTCWTSLPCVCQTHHVIWKFPSLASSLEMPFLEFQGHAYNSEEAVSYFCTEWVPNHMFES